MPLAGNETSSYEHIPLDVGEAPLINTTITVASGEGVVPRGAVLGRVTADGKYKLSLAAAGDGSEVARAVLAEEVDATAADATGQGIIMGVVNDEALTYGAGHDKASVNADLLGTPLLIKTVQEI